MKFIHTLSAAKGVEERTWAVADGLVQDFAEASVRPTSLHFKEAAAALEAAGYVYTPATLADYFRVASTFGASRRRASASVKLYEEILNPLWQRLDPDTRVNDIVAYAAEFFRGERKPSALKARAWAQAQAAGLDAERRAREEAEAKRQARQRLARNEALLAEAIEAGDWERAERELDTVNVDRRRLGKDLLKLDREEAEVATDEEATEEAQQQDSSERLHLEAKTAVEYALGRLGVDIAFLGNTFLRVQDHLTLEDRDAYAEEIELKEGRLALTRQQIGGLASDDALAAALAEWGSETSSEERR